MKRLSASGARQNLRGRSWKLLSDALDALVRSVVNHLQVFGAVVGLVAVNVMYQFVTLKVAAKHCLGNKTMLSNVAVVIGARVFGALQQPISVAVHHASALPARVLVALVRRTGDVFRRVLEATILMATAESHRPASREFRRTEFGRSHHLTASTSAWRCREFGSAWHRYIVADIRA